MRPILSRSREDYKGMFINGLLVVFVVLNLLMAMVMMAELVSVTTGDITQYPFGWEGGGIVYQNVTYYTLFCAIDVLVSGFVVVAFFLKRKGLLITSILLSLIYYTCYFTVLNPVFQG